MVTIERIDPPGFIEIKTFEPFQLQDLLDRAQADLQHYAPSEVFEQPFLLDFRAIDLLRFEASDFRRLINRRVRVGGSALDVPCAFVAASDASFGMLRMYGSYAEIGGLRDSDATYMTTDYGDARTWIEDAASSFHSARGTG